MKNNILDKYELPLVRLQTTGSGEDENIKSKLDEVLNKKH